MLIIVDKCFAIEENETKETTVFFTANISDQAKKGLIKINRESRNGSTIIKLKHSAFLYDVRVRL